MVKKVYCDRYPKSFALVLRLTETLHGSGRVIHGDSAFASIACCTALLSIFLLSVLCLSMGSTFLVFWKQPTRNSERNIYCQDLAFQASAQRGDTVTICTTKPIGNATKYIYGHVWNEPGSEGTSKEYHCEHMEPHTSCWWPHQEALEAESSVRGILRPLHDILWTEICLHVVLEL